MAPQVPDASRSSNKEQKKGGGGRARLRKRFSRAKGKAPKKRPGEKKQGETCAALLGELTLTGD